MGASTSSHPAPWMASSSSEPSDLMVAVNQFYPNGNPTIGEGDVPPIPAPEEERTVLGARITAEIEHSVEKGLRAYCNRPSVAKRFPIHFPTLDYSALAKRLVLEGLDVDLKSIEELRGLEVHVQNRNRIKGLFDDLLESLNEKE